MRTQDQVDQPLCLYGDRAGRRRAVLFGDSQAEHWFPAMHGGAQQAGWQLLTWTKSACTAASITPFRRNVPFHQCNQWREAVLRRLTETERPDVVVISGYANRRDFDVYDEAAGRPLPPDESREAWRNGFRKTLRRLTDAGVHVVVIRSAPLPVDTFASCLLTSAPCLNPRAKALIGAPVDAEVAREFGDRATVVDLTDVFCDAAGCPPIRDGIIVYRNKLHITATYAATLAPHMAELLRGFSGGRRQAGQSPRERRAVSPTSEGLLQ